MYDRSRSGQFLHFSLVGLYSGQILTGVSSGAISGRRTINGGSLTVCSGPVYEVGGGMYRLDLHSEDAAGDTIGFLFTSSGSIPVVMTVATQNNVSGKVYGASGLPVTASVWSGQLSGQGVTILTNSDKSGYTAGLISGVNFLASGHRVSVYSGQLSGQPVDVFVNNDKSGYTVGATTANSINAAAFAADVDAEILSYIVDDATRIDATALNTAAGTTIPSINTKLGTPPNLGGGADFGNNMTDIDASLTGIAGSESAIVNMLRMTEGTIGAVGNDTTHLHLTGLAFGDDELKDHLLVFYDDSAADYYARWITDWVNATALATITPALPVTPEDSTDTYRVLNVRRDWTLPSVAANSDGGLPVVGADLRVAASVASGTPVVASVWSGQLSGHQVTARTVSDKSGYTAALISGVNFLASGHLVNVYSGNLSGQEVVANAVVQSGLSVVATIYSGQLSGHLIDVFVNNDKSGYTAGSISGTTHLASGSPVRVYSGNLSGQEVVANATVQSGLSVIASLYSGAVTAPFPGSLSGQVVDVLVNNDKSGYTAGVVLDKSGYTAGVVLDKSGYTAALISGATYLASGVILKEVLTGAFSGLPDVSGQRNLLNAARKLMNAFDLTAASGHLSVYREDDSTLAYRQAVTVASGAQPIGGLDTV